MRSSKQAHGRVDAAGISMCCPKGKIGFVLYAIKYKSMVGLNLIDVQFANKVDIKKEKKSLGD